MSETSAKHKAEAPKTLNYAVITCSTSRYREFAETGKIDDPSGDLIAQILRSNGQRVTLRRLVSDDKSTIQQAVTKALKQLRFAHAVSSPTALALTSSFLRLHCARCRWSKPGRGPVVNRHIDSVRLPAWS